MSPAATTHVSSRGLTSPHAGSSRGLLTPETEEAEGQRVGAFRTVV
jgi:hypothetical protein